MGRGLFLIVLAAVMVMVPASAHAQSEGPLIIAHRGASGERPEHTLAAYERAIDQGADYIEMDLVPTSDGVLVARHENALAGTTDVADRPEFAGRRTTKTIDGEQVTDWFAEEFTLAELRTLRARERLPDIRPQNVRFDGLWQVPTLAEIIALVRAKEAETGRVIGIYPEIKHPTYFAGIGHDLAAMLVEHLHAAGYRGEDAPVFIQSFDAAPLRRLDAMTDLRLVQLVAVEGGPADDPAMSYAEMVTPEGLAQIATYADGIGADFATLFAIAPDAQAAMPTGVHFAARDAGLLVHSWTARKENAFLPPAFRTGDDPAAIGCDYLVYYLMRGFEIDGVFSDDPARAIRFGQEIQEGCPEELAAVVE